MAGLRIQRSEVRILSGIAVLPPSNLAKLPETESFSPSVCVLDVRAFPSVRFSFLSTPFTSSCRSTLRYLDEERPVMRSSGKP